MQSDTVTCSFVMDRNTYNMFENIVTKCGQNVKSNIIAYMQSVIRYDIPNADTILAIQEVENLKKNPHKKVYGSFGEVLEELNNE